MKYLGIDYGTKRVGMAISDEDASFAFPRGIVSLEEAPDAIASLAKEEHVETAVVGYSIASNGEANAIAPLVQRFVEKLQEAGLTVALEREDYSSVEAHRYQTSAGNRDDSAAAIILQRFLDKKKRQ